VRAWNQFFCHATTLHQVLGIYGFKREMKRQSLNVNTEKRTILKAWYCRLQTGQESGKTRKTTREFYYRQLDNTTMLLGLSPLLSPVMDPLGRVTASAVSRRCVTAGVRGQYQANSCEYCCGQSDCLTGPYPNMSAFSFQYRSKIAPTLIHSSVTEVVH
jgi:hypothetical protein